MVKYNRVTLARKKELEKPDEFIVFSKRLIELGQKYKLQLSIGTGVILSLLIIFLGMRFFSNLAEDKAFTLLQEGMKKYDTAAKDEDSEQVNEDVTADIETVLTKYPRTVAGKLARIHLANISYDTGKYDKAIALYEKAVIDFKNSPSLKNLVLSSLGHCYEAKKDNSSAVKYFEMITKGQNEVLKDEAFFSLGRIYDHMGNKTKRIEVLQKIVKEYKDSVYFDLAQESTTGKQS